MAGFAMMGVNHGSDGTGILNVSSILEFRGNSYGIGGDTDAFTLANFIKHYSPKVKGASVLSHVMSFCSAKDCLFPKAFCKFILYSLKEFTANYFIDRPLIDNLNAAQSGAINYNLDHELDYLIPRKFNYT